MTPLETAITAVLSDPMDEARLRALYATLAACELCLLLEEEAEGDSLRPRLFPLDDGPVALVFDTEDRLADFAGAAPFAALSGRVLAGLLAGQRVGLGVNLGSAAEYMLPPAAIDWIAGAAVTSESRAEMPVSLSSPGDLPATLLPVIEPRLASCAGLARQAVLAIADYADGRRRPLLAFIGARAGAEGALSQSIAEALAMAGLDPEELDFVFLPEGVPAAERMVAAGVVIDLPEPPAPPKPRIPGSDPDRPPKLR